MSQWTAFPYPDAAYRYSAAALKKNWPRLHLGDGEPWPEHKPAQDAWRAYHAGDFALALETGLPAGPSGINAANKAAMIYTAYLEDDADARLAAYQAIAARCEALQEQEPDNANAWYIHAYALGRYSQGISIARALAQGLGGKVKASLERTLALSPKHADAMIALGTWHTEIVAKVGGLVAGITYGAKKEEAERLFKTALALNPGSAIARTEYADALVTLYGKSRLKDAEKLYAEAAACTAADAMERLDIEAARTELED
ncbi:hypothetical protein [Craterilacuibacter sp.]|uniref:hypothetical protein n=1 Tax=Craterilacuibacter sp. TaxID=2870909 RepID=UPI003F3FBBAC